MTTSIRSGSTDGALQLNGVDTVAFDANGIKGVTSQVTTTGGTTTLSPAQINATAIEISGVLASQAIIVVPNNMAIKSFENLTTGAFTVTVQTAAGTGFVLDPGSKQPAYANGTNAESLSGMGYGQMWQAVARSVGVTYYNTTPRPIVLTVYCQSSISGYIAIQVVSGYNAGLATMVATMVATQYSGCTGIIPPGVGYYWSGPGGTVTNLVTAELR